MAFIDGQRLRFGVAPICTVLTEHGCGIAPSSSDAHRLRSPSPRALRDAQLVVEIRRVDTERRIGRSLYGARKVWLQLHREGIAVARCTVERLMRQERLVGCRRGGVRRTTRADPAAVRPPDLVDRRFVADAPNQLWVVDFTYLATWQSMAYTAFVIDVFSRRIVGWRTASTMPTELPLDALEMALFTRTSGGQDVAGVIHHSDAGSNTPPFATPSGCWTPARYHRSAASATRTITPSRRARSGSTKPSVSVTTGPGGRSTRWSSGRCHGSTGTTPTVCTPASATSRHWSTNSTTTTVTSTAGSSRSRHNQVSTEPGAVHFGLNTDDNPSHPT